MISKSFNDVYIGIGNLNNKGVYANKDFKQGEIVINYNLKQLSEEEYNNLSDEEKMFTHVHLSKIYLYSEPERFVNHSNKPNTYQDLLIQADIALRDIKKDEMITTDSSKDDVETLEYLPIKK